MPYKVQHILNEEGDILIRRVTGTVTMKEVIASWERDLENGVVHKNLKGVVTDFLEGKNEAQIGELKDIVEFYKKNFELFRHIKLAVVLDSPNVAILLMFEDVFSEIKHKAFATVEAALTWVQH